MLEAICAVAGLVIGWWIRGRIASADRRELKDKVWHRANLLNDAETRYLSVLHRELANCLIQIDPALMERAYRRARHRQDEALEGGKERVAAELQVLTHRYPLFSDFDLVGTKHFVPYSELSRYSNEDSIVDRYLDVSTWLALRNAADQQKVEYRLFNSADEKIFFRLMDEVRASHLKSRIDATMEGYSGFMSSLRSYVAGGNMPTSPTYESKSASVFRQEFNLTPELVYCLAFKDPEEYAIYTSYNTGDGRFMHSYYRSDRGFSERKLL